MSGGRILHASVAIVVLALLVLPLIIALTASFDSGQFFTFPPRHLSTYWYGEVLAQEVWRESAWVSAKIAAMTALVSGFTGVCGGIAIGRANVTSRRFLLAMTLSPQIIPGIVIAVSLYVYFLRLDVIGSLIPLVIANSLFGASIVTLVVAAQTAALDVRTEMAARSCGAGAIWTLLLVTLPGVFPSALAGTALAALATLDEVVISQFLATFDFIPLPVRLYQEVKQGAPSIVNAIASLLNGFAVAAVLVRLGYLHRRSAAHAADASRQ